MKKKTVPAPAVGRGDPPRAPGLDTGFPSPWAGSMACNLRVISLVPESGTSLSRAKGNRWRALPGNLSGSLLKSSRMARPGRCTPEPGPRLPLTPQSIHRHHLSPDHQDTEAALAFRLSGPSAPAATVPDYGTAPCRLPVNRRHAPDQLSHEFVGRN